MELLIEQLEQMKGKIDNVGLVKLEITEMVTNEIIEHHSEAGLKKLLVEKAKEVIVNHPATALLNHLAKRGDDEVLKVYDYEAYESELVDYASKEAKRFLRSAPSSNLLAQYISLVKRTGVAPMEINEETNVYDILVQIGELKEKTKNPDIVVTEDNLMDSLREAQSIAKEKKITQDEVARHIGCSNQKISQSLKNPFASEINKAITVGYIQYVLSKDFYKLEVLDKRKGKGADKL